MRPFTPPGKRNRRLDDQANRTLLGNHRLKCWDDDVRADAATCPFSGEPPTRDCLPQELISLIDVHNAMPQRSSWVFPIPLRFVDQDVAQLLDIPCLSHSVMDNEVFRFCCSHVSSVMRAEPAACLEMASCGRHNSTESAIPRKFITGAISHLDSFSDPKSQ